MLSRYERGQALFETVIFLPIMIFSMYAVFEAVTQGAMIERVQLGVRYGGQISTVQNPFLSDSLYAMYATVDGHAPDQNTCNGASADTTMMTARHTFWQPLAGATTSVCWEFTAVSYAASYSGFSDNGTATTPNPFNYLTHENFIRLTTKSAVPGYLGNGFGTQNELAATNFIRPASVGDILTCTYTGAAVKNSLEAINSSPPLGYQYNGGGSIPGGSISSPLPTTMPDVITLPFLTCNSFTGQVAPSTPPPF